MPDWRPNQDYRKSYSADSAKGGGVLFDLIHEFDYAEWFFGPVTLMQGKVGKFSNLEIKSDDYCLMNLQHANGQGTVELSYAEKTPVRGFELRWERGLVRGDLLLGTLEIVPDGKEPSRRNCSVADRDVLYREQVTILAKNGANLGASVEYFHQSMELNRKLVRFRQKK